MTYDTATNSVRIDSAQPYREETSIATSGPTEERVQAALALLRETYPTGIVFPAPYRSTSDGSYSQGVQCSGWATLCSDAAFGNLPWRRINRPNREHLRSGNLVEYQNFASYHVVVVVDKIDEYIKVTKSGTNSHTR